MHNSLELPDLKKALDPRRFGNKAARLARAAGAGLRVPPGRVLSCSDVRLIVAREPESLSGVLRAARELGRYVAVRSSAPEEDSASASHAGQFTTVLHVPVEPEPLIEAIEQVARSADAVTDQAHPPPHSQSRGDIAVLLQRMVAARSAGVLFTRHPVSGANELVIESNWGVGEALVSGKVVPDYFRVSRSGQLLESHIGSKKVSLVPQEGGGLRQVHPRMRLSSLSKQQVRELADLGEQCETLFGFPVDVEWAYSARMVLYLLQCRPITTTAGQMPVPSTN